jgi:coproporphyrinogen III oxidase
MRDAMRRRMEELVRAVQQEICVALSAATGQTFREDTWTREGGGGGTSRVTQDGKVFDKAGVNVSVVHGELSLEAARAMGGGKHARDDELAFFATGISLVLHPTNPFAPTVHANYRYLERGSAWWFGGGADLTPSYLFDDDARHFHAALKEACDAHDRSFYPRFKKQADEYFFLPHRGERRGIGGIFFDDMHDRACDELFGFVTTCARSFLPAYLPLLERRKDMPFTPEHKRWQELRRGRYVEFNLIYDRGTVFGLRTGGRVESILMSLPLQARWEYDAAPPAGSREAELLSVLQKPREWI